MFNTARTAASISQHANPSSSSNTDLACTLVNDDGTTVSHFSPSTGVKVPTCVLSVVLAVVRSIMPDMAFKKLLSIGSGCPTSPNARLSAEIIWGARKVTKRNKFVFRFFIP